TRQTVLRRAPACRRCCVIRVRDQKKASAAVCPVLWAHPSLSISQSGKVLLLRSLLLDSAPHDAVRRHHLGPRCSQAPISSHRSETRKLLGHPLLRYRRTLPALACPPVQVLELRVPPPAWLQSYMYWQFPDDVLGKWG